MVLTANKTRERPPGRSRPPAEVDSLPATADATRLQKAASVCIITAGPRRVPHHVRAGYPRDWPEISNSIRFGRAGGRCECAGECGSGHVGRCEARHGEPHPVTGGRVVLTTAHRDREPRNCSPENLFAACQRCHIWYDRDQHRANAAWTRAGRPDVQLELFPREQSGSVRRQGPTAGLYLAKDVVRVARERGAVRDDELLAILHRDREELKSAIGIAIRWRRIDACGDFLVPIPSPREGRRAA